MDLGRGVRERNRVETKELRSARIGSNSNHVPLLIVKLPDYRVLRIVSRSVFLTVVILALPSIGCIIRGYSNASNDSSFVPSDAFGFASLPAISQYLAEEGFIKSGEKGVILSSGDGDSVEEIDFWKDNAIDFATEAELSHENQILNEKFDFIFALSFPRVKFINRILKIGGILVLLMSNDPAKAFQLQSNYKIVYLREFDSTTAVVIRKTGPPDGSANSQANQRRLSGVTATEAKSLTHLETALLEPPLTKSISSSYESKFKLLTDMLENSPLTLRRGIFIAGEKNSVLDWFFEKHPTRNQHFEFYKLDIDEIRDQKRVGMSDWLRKKNTGEAERERFG